MVLGGEERVCGGRPRCPDAAARLLAERCATAAALLPSQMQQQPGSH